MIEALEEARTWKPLYEAVLKQTKDKDLAKRAVLFAKRMASELEKKAS